MNLFNLCSKTVFINVANAIRKSSVKTVYSSSIGLDKLYPSSSLKLTTPKEVPSNTGTKFNGYIPVEELTITFSHSPGPGGQSVNKSNTKVDLRFHLASAKWLHEDIRNAMLERKNVKLSNEGFLIIRSDKTRSQQLNVTDAMDKLRTMIREAAEPPKELSPESIEKQRRDREKATRRRLIEKRMKSFTKSQRSAPLV